MPDGVPISAGAGVGVKTQESPVNLTGTVAKNGTVTVTGTGTTFSSQLAVGDVVRIPGGGGTEDRVIQAIATDTSLTVTVAFANTASAQTGQRVEHVQVVQFPRSSAATRTQVADTTTEGVLLAADPMREGASIVNDSSADLYVGLGTTTVSATNYTVRLARFDYYEVPDWAVQLQVRGVWATDPNDGAARITTGT